MSLRYCQYLKDIHASGNQLLSFKIDEVADEREKLIARCVNVLEILAVALVADRPEPFPDHDLGKADDDVQRGPDFVADLGQEIRSIRIPFLGLALGLDQLLLGPFPLGKVAKDGTQLV